MPPAAGNPAPQLQLIHVGAVNLSHSGGLYSVRGVVSFIIRDGPGGDVLRFRLQPEHPPASPAAAPTAIEVCLSGQWRSGAKNITRYMLVQIDSPLVTESDQRHLNPVRLELVDSMHSNTHSAHTAVHILNEERQLCSSLTFPALSFGFLESRTPSGARPTATPALWASSSRRTAGPAISSVGESSRGYNYTSIARLWEMTEGSSFVSSRAEKVNVYGVVVDCRAPCTTRGPDLRCEVLVADESSFQNDGEQNELKTMAIYCFERNATDGIPFRSVGDVIRAHRINYGRYYDSSTGKHQVQGMGRFFSTFLLWSHEGTDFHPVASREPVRVSNQSHIPEGGVTHVVSSQDRERIRSLRSWARNYLFKLHKIHRPYLRSVLEINAADPSAEFLAKSFDLVCRFEANVTDGTGPGALKFTVSDGLLSRNMGSQHLLVESITSPEQALHDRDAQFVDFCPSWNNRPDIIRAWLLIRDVKVVSQGSNRVIQLSVGKKTSTLVWHPEYSPDVQKIKDSFTRATAVNRMPAAAPSRHNATGSADVRVGTGPVAPGNIRFTQSRAGTGGPVDALQQRQSSVPGERGMPSHVGSAQIDPTVPQAVLQRIPGIPQLSARPKRHPPQPPPDGVGMPTNPPLRKVPRTDVAMRSVRDRSDVNGHRSHQFDERNVSTLKQNVGRGLTTISDHSNKHFQVSSIAEMQKSVARKSLGPHRLLASARSCISPRDVRFACRPWCRECKKFLKVDPNHGLLECLTCSKKYQSTGDPNTEWAYLVRLNLEDYSGSRIECWIDGDEASEFFAGLPATSLLSNTGARQRVNKSLQAVLSPKNQLDCCVMPYEYEDKNGVYRTACKLFATALLPEAVSG